MKIQYLHGGRQKETYGEEEVVNVVCPLCGNDSYVEIYKERVALGIARCKKCGLIYANPRLKNPEAVYWGDSDEYYKEARLIFDNKAAHHRDANYMEDLRLIHRYKPAGKFLDVGSNAGFFLNNAKKIAGWDLYGVEPSSSLSEMARKHFRLNIKTAFLEEAGFENGSFDVIAMTDVFEHITDPGRILNEARRILKPDGILFIKVPNGLFNLFKLRVATILGSLNNYDIFDSYEHVVHYSGRTLKEMLGKNGFRLVTVRIGKPIHVPVWHNYVGQYYQYRCPWVLDYKRQSMRTVLYFLSQVEFLIYGKNIGYLAPNIIALCRKGN